MVKDYAKYASAHYKPAKKGMSTKALLALLVVVVVALIVAFVPWGSREGVQGETQDLNVAVSTAAQPTTMAAEMTPVTTAESDQPTFDFYDILSDSDPDADDAPAAMPAKAMTSSTEKPEVVVAVAPVTPVASISAPKKVTAAPTLKTPAPTPVASKKTEAVKAGTAPHRYMISLGEYKKYQDAQKHRAALILNGLDVSLATLSSAKQELYRLETGPYINWREAHAAQLTLEQQYQIRGKIVQ